MSLWRLRVSFSILEAQLQHSQLRNRLLICRKGFIFTHTIHHTPRQLSYTLSNVSVYMCVDMYLITIMVDGTLNDKLI